MMPIFVLKAAVLLISPEELQIALQIHGNMSFICEIADLAVSVPDTGGYTSRFQDYVAKNYHNPEVIIDPKEFRWNLYSSKASFDDICYCESSYSFSCKMIPFGGFVLHASAIESDNKAYLFSGPSGIGKSTHTGQWLKEFSEGTRIINDDKPPLRKIEGVWYAYGSPWCGKNNVQVNTKVPLAGICFLKQSEENSIRRLSSKQALSRILAQTIHRFSITENMDLMMQILNKLIAEIPIFEMENYPGPESAQLSYATMTEAAEEMGL